jgi:hypothetical protein
MEPTLVFLRAEVSLVILKALFDAILADGGCLVESGDRSYKTRSFRMGLILDDECVRCSVAY